MSTSTDSVVFFDDVCVLCNGAVLTLIKLDKKRELKYSSLTGNFAQSLPDLKNLNSSQSVIFWTEGKVYYRAQAVIHILLKLGGVCKFLGSVLKLFPLFSLNAFYNLIAKNRYRIFGKRDVCLVPSAEIKERFIP